MIRLLLSCVALLAQAVWGLFLVWAIITRTSCENDCYYQSLGYVVWLAIQLLLTPFVIIAILRIRRSLSARTQP
jgi:hypothetical protein